jgi:hypothetical protein
MLEVLDAVVCELRLRERRNGLFELLQEIEEGIGEGVESE